MPIYSTENENDIVLLPERTHFYLFTYSFVSLDIPKNQNLIQVPHAKGIVVGLTLYHGDYENFPDVREFSVLISHLFVKLLRLSIKLNFQK